VENYDIVPVFSSETDFKRPINSISIPNVDRAPSVEIPYRSIPNFSNAFVPAAKISALVTVSLVDCTDKVLPFHLAPCPLLLQMKPTVPCPSDLYFHPELSLM